MVNCGMFSVNAVINGTVILCCTCAFSAAPPELVPGDPLRQISDVKGSLY